MMYFNRCGDTTGTSRNTRLEVNGTERRMSERQGRMQKARKKKEMKERESWPTGPETHSA